MPKARLGLACSAFGNLFICYEAGNLCVPGSTETFVCGVSSKVMTLRVRRSLRYLSVLLVFVGTLSAYGAQWSTLGPEGGDVRSLSCDPTNPDHLFLGTSNGEIFASQDGGHSWNRLPRPGYRDDFIFHHIVVDPHNPKTVYVSAWSLQDPKGGDIFRSKDSGKSWEPLADMHNKSVRALAVFLADPKILIAGVTDGIYRSTNHGKNWEKISPADHPEITSVESVALDPQNPNIIYAGTVRHLWKTVDGGLNWLLLKKGISDNTDVSSILVNKSNGSMFVAAGPGIFKSEGAGEAFSRIQSATWSANHTRVLRQDPGNERVIYAGTTEGLWKSVDQGKNWKRMTGSDIVVNEVIVDPRNSQHVVLATESMGVLASEDGAKTFLVSNQGFTHRYIGTIRADRSNPQVIYVGVVNDHEAGGVFISRDGGMQWQQNSNGLHGYDVFALDQASNGTWLAGTSQGMFLLEKNSVAWRPSNAVVNERGTPRLINVNGRARRVMSHTAAHGVLRAQINDLYIASNRWLAATSAGLYSSSDQGKLWSGGPVLGKQDFIAVKAEKEFVVAATRSNLLISNDGGTVWREPPLHQIVSRINGLILLPRASIYIATREGAFLSGDGGATWEHLANGLPGKEIDWLTYDTTNNRLLATSSGSVFESMDKGRTWRRSADTGYALGAITVVRGRVLAATRYDGVISELAATGK
jgi:photosystem II stability/assembly factor-like uncharacterized protein